MALTVNAQFNKFLEFAQSQANAASSKAKQTIYKINHGEDFPLGHKKTVTVA